ncbi:hypothetical protein [Jiangella endophytica]|nr:hypothetical protein [Jiangella endophytica]
MSASLGDLLVRTRASEVLASASTYDRDGLHSIDDFLTSMRK